MIPTLFSVFPINMPPGHNLKTLHIHISYRFNFFPGIVDVMKVRKIASCSYNNANNFNFQ